VLCCSIRSDVAGALAIALSDPPYGNGLEEARASIYSITSEWVEICHANLRCVQSTTLATVLSILNTTRSTDIAKTVAALDPASQDTLMKYLYKGMAAVEEGGNCSVLLNWHEKVRVQHPSPQSYRI
jgi:actin related protein 2/3 complex subunit 5